MGIYGDSATIRSIMNASRAENCASLTVVLYTALYHGLLAYVHHTRTNGHG